LAASDLAVFCLQREGTGSERREGAELWRKALQEAHFFFNLPFSTGMEQLLSKSLTDLVRGIRSYKKSNNPSGEGPYIQVWTSFWFFFFFERFLSRTASRRFARKSALRLRRLKWAQC
jgi:hypothetical protein